MNHTSHSCRTKRNLSKLLIVIASILTVGLLNSATALAGGTLDPTFGDAGVAHINFGFNATALARRVLIQPDGKLVLAGSVEGDAALVRLNSDGSLDSTFGDGGKVQTDLFPSQIDVKDAALQADGKIVVVGAFRAINNLPTHEIEIPRYTSTGRSTPVLTATACSRRTSFHIARRMRWRCSRTARFSQAAATRTPPAELSAW